ncbi:MAG: DUF4390 domain-containing protein [Deltaproteobacteria bacterium]|jgi:hypothetical protein|nr:DUF4390 domain-containing protein [Deltaproteobacteria bacterium]
MTAYSAEKKRNSFFPAGRIFLPICLTALLFYWLCSPGAAAAPERFAYDPPRIAEREGILYLALSLSVDNEDSLGDLLREGVNLELKVEVSVERKRFFWFNEEMAELSFSSQLRHDPLTREFRLTLSGNSQVFRDELLRRLLAGTWKKLEFPLLESSLFEKEEEYLVDMNLTLKRTEVPVWLERTLMFWTRDVVEPEHIVLKYAVQDGSLPE